MKENNGNKKIGIMFFILVIIAAFVVVTSLVFKIDKIDFEIISTPNFELNEGIKTELENTYKNQSFIYFSLLECESYIEKTFPYVKIEQLKREFPNILVLSVSERYEVFAVKNNEKFDILDAEGKLLRVSDDVVSNRNTTLIEVNGNSDFLSKIVQLLISEGYVDNVIEASEVISKIEFSKDTFSISFKLGQAYELSYSEEGLKVVFSKYFVDLDK